MTAAGRPLQEGLLDRHAAVPALHCHEWARILCYFHRALIAPAVRTSAQRRSAPSRVRAMRVQAALTALAFVLASLFGVFHEAATTHVRCAEHGELIHRDATVANTERAGRDPILGDLRAEAVASHEHCSLASATRESRLVPCPPAIVSAPVAISALAVATPGAVPARGGGLYRTAPKTSPPA